MKQIALNCDCMEYMKTLPDKYFELAIVDPPYGIGDKKLTQGGTWASKYNQGDAEWDIAPDKEYFNELFRVSQNQIIWGGNYFNLPPTRCFIIWDKVAHMPTMADCEYAWTSFDSNAKIFCHMRNSEEKRIHICQKPTKLYSWILMNYAKQGDKILDTHLGSGSSRIAAYNLNFEFVGCEIDKDYFDKQEERFKSHISQIRMPFMEEQ